MGRIRGATGGESLSDTVKSERLLREYDRFPANWIGKEKYVVSLVCVSVRVVQHSLLSRERVFFTLDGFFGSENGALSVDTLTQKKPSWEWLIKLVARGHQQQQQQKHIFYELLLLHLKLERRCSLFTGALKKARTLSSSWRLETRGKGTVVCSIFFRHKAVVFSGVERL